MSRRESVRQRKRKAGRLSPRAGPAPEEPAVLLRRLISRRRITQTALAEAAGVSLRSIGRIVCGWSTLTVDMAIRLAGPLHTTARRLVVAQLEYDLWRARAGLTGPPQGSPARAKPGRPPRRSSGTRRRAASG